MKKMTLRLVRPSDFTTMYIFDEPFKGTERGIKREARKEQRLSGLGFLTAVLESPRGATVFIRGYNEKSWTKVR